MALSVSLTRKKTFRRTEKITSGKLNQLANPDVAIAGAASSAQIGDATVTTAKSVYGAWFYGSGAGTASAHTVAVTPSITSYSDGLIIRYKTPAASTGAVTVNVSSLGAKNLYKLDGSVALAAGDLRTNQIIEVVYNSSLNAGVGGFQLLSVISNKESVHAQDAGSTDAYVVGASEVISGTLPTSYVTGFHARVKANTVNTGAATLNVNALGAIAIKKEGTSDLSDGDIKAGQWFEVVYDGTNFQLLSPTTAIVNATVVGLTRGLVMKNDVSNPDYQITITADDVIVKDSSNRSYGASAVSLTANIQLGTGVANGLDSGSEQASTWYYIWAIYNGTTVASLLSTSSTAPVLPSGYTYKALLGHVYNDASSNFQRIYQLDRTVFLQETMLFTELFAASTTAFQSISGTAGKAVELSTLIPPTAKTVGGIVGGSNSHALVTVAGGTSITDVYGSITVCGNSAGATQNSFYASAPFEVPVLTTQDFYWRGATTTQKTRMSITFYRF